MCLVVPMEVGQSCNKFYDLEYLADPSTIHQKYQFAFKSVLQHVINLYKQMPAWL